MEVTNQPVSQYAQELIVVEILPTISMFQVSHSSKKQRGKIKKREKIKNKKYILAFICLSGQKSGQKHVENLAKKLAEWPVVLGPKTSSM